MLSPDKLVKGRILMRNFKKTLFYLGFSVCSIAASIASAQDSNADQDIQGNRAPSKVYAARANPIFASKPQVILFKIHEIKPVLNSDGVVVSCEYTATFYNRTPLSLRQAKIDFGWSDHISDLFAIEETPASEEAAPQAPAPAKDEGLGTIRSSVDIPALGSLKQVSVHGTAETDKCFALFDNLKFNVPVCNILGQDSTNDTRRGRVDNEQINCAGMFAYVNSQHPEYYGEFKEISYEEQVEREKTQEEKETEMLSNINENINENFEKTNTVIGNIK